jgi:hypothetical protein
MDNCDINVIKIKVNKALQSNTKKDLLDVYINERVSNVTGDYIIQHLKNKGFKYKSITKEVFMKGMIDKSVIVDNQVGSQMMMDSSIKKQNLLSIARPI